MTWASLELWAVGEEKRIHNCIKAALRRLIHSQEVNSEDDELTVSGKLRPFLYRVRKEMKLSWSLQSEASSFREIDDTKPFGHPDFRFTVNTPEYHDVYDYDIECKLVRIKPVRSLGRGFNPSQDIDRTPSDPVRNFYCIPFGIK